MASDGAMKASTDESSWLSQLTSLWLQEITSLGEMSGHKFGENF